MALAETSGVGIARWSGNMPCILRIGVCGFDMQSSDVNLGKGYTFRGFRPTIWN